MFFNENLVKILKVQKNRNFPGGGDATARAGPGAGPGLGPGPRRGRAGRSDVRKGHRNYVFYNVRSSHANQIFYFFNVRSSHGNQIII